MSISTPKPLIFGEVLFDCFEDGVRILGGAPFNVAWNLQGLGLSPLFYSCVGDDADGAEVARRMQQWEMSTQLLQTSKRWPTGRVEVKLDDGQPTYSILPNQAYDDVRIAISHIPSAEQILLYHGTLALRQQSQRDALGELINAGLDRFVDINVRQPWFEPSWCDSLLAGAAWLKLNDEELALLSEQEHLRAAEELEKAGELVRRRYGVRNLLVTCGADGALCMVEGMPAQFQAAPSVSKIADTVGAGDALASAMIYGIISGIDMQRVLAVAVRYAAHICSNHGATSGAIEFYRPFRAELERLRG